MEAVSNRRPDEILSLWPVPVAPATAGGEAFQPFMECYFRPDRAPALVIFPGGAYCTRAAHEGREVAVRFNELGFHSFVVHYRVAPYRYPEPQRDALRAVKLVRSRFHDRGVDGARVAVCGFSAGGHLAGCTGTLFDRIGASAGDEADGCASRPEAMILCYPVIDFSEEFGHRKSAQNLLGRRYDAKREELSLEYQVSFDTPPVFLWHTATDEGVPVEHSLAFAAAMRKHNLPWELHVFPTGRHGLGLARELPAASVWPVLAAAFLQNYC